MKIGVKVVVVQKDAWIHDADDVIALEQERAEDRRETVKEGREFRGSITVCCVVATMPHGTDTKRKRRKEDMRRFDSAPKEFTVML